MRYVLLAILIVAAGLIAGLTTGVPGPEPERPVRESPGPMVRAQVGWTRCSPTSATAVPGQCYVTTTKVIGAGGGQ